jgi:hypothetical protein
VWRSVAVSKFTVYRSFEVREGFGPHEVGPLLLETPSRSDADDRLELMWAEGSCVQLFGIKNDEGEDGTRVLLRSLVGRRAA